jgi:hypothetical protein
MLDFHVFAACSSLSDSNPIHLLLHVHTATGRIPSKLFSPLFIFVMLMCFVDTIGSTSPVREWKHLLRPGPHIVKDLFEVRFT